MRLPLFVAVSVFFLAGWASTSSAEVDLYTAQAIVTGTDMRNRPSGFALCLRNVLVKVSGNPSLAVDPRIDPLAQHAEDWVTTFGYHDRMSGIPRHDEQGTRDRPYDLSVQFDPNKIDQTLKTLGERPWTTDRGRLFVILRITNGMGRSYILRAAGDDGKDQREALVEAAAKYGLSFTLPENKTPSLEKSGEYGLVPLHASLQWADKDRGWVGSWHLVWHKHRFDWQVRGVSFDDAFRDMMRGCLQILSNHGAPPAIRLSKQ